MSFISLYSVPNGVGISRDVEIIKKLLIEEGYEVETQHCFNFRPKEMSKFNIFLERFNPPLLSFAEQNIIIPNQEWFEDSWHPFLKHFDHILTKTHFATDVFKKLGCNTRYIGFTSEDRYLPNVKKDFYSWVHVVGKSIQKQTDIVWETWQKNPGFPTLTIIQDLKHFKSRPGIKNVNYIYSRISDDLLKLYQNNNLVHVCPSETEGFGHYIMEALSCEAIVLTTGAAPMNELVKEEYGFFVKPVKQERMRLSLKNVISIEELEKSVININITEESKLLMMGKKGREFYLQNKIEFEKNFKDAMRDIVNKV